MVHIIAEAGTNHNGSLETACKLVAVAKRAGADSVKFQIINPDGLYLPGKYEFGKYDIEEVRSLRRRFMLSDSAYRALADYSAKEGLPFSASVFDREGVDLLKSLNPPYIKIASTDLNNFRLLRMALDSDLPIILSTGMSSLGDIEKSVKMLGITDTKRLVLMHCVSVYPSQLRDTNLSFIDTLKSAFGFPVGFSDHTQSSVAACLAVTKGVSFIEKHFTLDRRQEGFDHAYAAEETELLQYVRDIRDTELALSPKPNKLSDSELYTRKRARRSLYAARDLEPGTVLTPEDILVVRPENEMSADQIDDLIGATLTQHLPAYTPFSMRLLASRNTRP